jgi:TonB dependent receptor.
MYMHFDMGNMGYMIIGNPDLEPEKSHNFNLAVERQNRIRHSGILDGAYNFPRLTRRNPRVSKMTRVRLL